MIKRGVIFLDAVIGKCGNYIFTAANSKQRLCLSDSFDRLTCFESHLPGCPNTTLKLQFQDKIYRRNLTELNSCSFSTSHYSVAIGVKYSFYILQKKQMFKTVFDFMELMQP